MIAAGLSGETWAIKGGAVDKVYDIQKAIVLEDEVALALLDTRYKAVMIIKPEGDRFVISEPDGAERLSWLLRLGAMTVAEVEEESSKLGRVQKQRLVKKLQESLRDGGET